MIIVSPRGLGPRSQARDPIMGFFFFLVLWFLTKEAGTY